MRDFIGSFQLARKIFESDIFYKKPPEWFKVWVFILGICNYEDKKQFQKGECLTSYAEISQYTKANKNQIKHCIEWLKHATQIATRKTTRGFYIKVINYDYYQCFDSYKSKTINNTESHTERKIEATEKPQRSHTILKKYKNDKNDKNIIDKIDIADKSAIVIFSYKEILKDMRSSPKDIDRILAFFWEKKKFVFENSKQLSIRYGRDCKGAKQIIESGYNEKQIENTFLYVEKKYSEVDWTLETLLKALAEANK